MVGLPDVLPKVGAVRKLAMQTQFNRSPITRCCVTAEDTTMAMTLTWLRIFGDRSADCSARPGLEATKTLDPDAEHAPSCGSELRIYQQGAGPCCVRIRREDLQVPPPDEDPGQPADRDVAAVIRCGRVVAPVEPVFPVGVAEAVEVSNGVAHHFLHAAAYLGCICRQVQFTSIPVRGTDPVSRGSSQAGHEAQASPAPPRPAGYEYCGGFGVRKCALRRWMLLAAADYPRGITVAAVAG